MAIADAVVPSPPPSRFVVAPRLALARAAAHARPYVGSAVVWVVSACSAAAIVARRVCGEDYAPLVVFDAIMGAAHKAYVWYFYLYLAYIALLLCLHCLAFLADMICDLVYEFNKGAYGQKFLEFIDQELNMSRRTAVLGGLTYGFCTLLIVTGYLVAMISRGEKNGSLIMDVGTFGIHPTSCLVFIPAFAWREVQRDRRRRLLRKNQDKVSED